MYLNEIFIFIKNLKQVHIGAVWWVLDILKKINPFAYLKKSCIHQNKVYFLDYIVFSQGSQDIRQKNQSCQELAKTKVLIWHLNIRFLISGYIIAASLMLML